MPLPLSPAVNEQPPCAPERRWYAAYTRARHEKQVAARLQARAVECFLPLNETVRQWNDRRAVVAMPLFSGYVFVRIGRGERLDVLTAPGVLHLVTRGGEPTPIPDEEIERIQQCMRSHLQVEPHGYIPTGSRVLVKAGPLTGLEGILVRHGNGTRLVLSISVIESSVAVEVDVANVVTIAPRRATAAHPAA